MLSQGAQATRRSTRSVRRLQPLLMRSRGVLVLCAQQLTKPYPEEDRPYDCVQTDEASACMVCLDCEGQAREYANLVKVSEKKQLFNFAVESTGAMRPELIVMRAIEVMQRKMKDIRGNLRSAEENMAM